MDPRFGIKNQPVSLSTIRLHFEAKYTKRSVDKCWEWNGTTVDSGNIVYGMFRFRKRMELAHRVSYTFYTGKIPDGMQVLHTCDNGLCVNPNHLFLGTHTDNMQDMSRKWRARPRGLRQKTCRC
jgi:hypothetical protein